MDEEQTQTKHRLTALEMIEHNKPLQEHWIRRLVAAAIDFIIVYVVALVIGIIMVLGLGPFSIIFTGILALFWVFYSSIMEYLYGATIGKKLMGLKVQSLRGPFDLYKAILRNLSKIHGIFLLIDTIAGMITEGDPRQRFLDRIAETTVVSAPHHLHREKEESREMQGENVEKQDNASPPEHVEYGYQGNP